jgi:flagellar hook-basal body complex protein FliE
VAVVRVNPYAKITQNISMDDPESNTVNSMENRVSFNPMKKMLNQVNDSQLQSEQSQISFAMGESESIHSVIVNMEDALMSMRLATQVRNRAIDAYQEVMRMQV